MKCDNQLSYEERASCRDKDTRGGLEKGQVNQVVSCGLMHLLSYFRCNFAWGN